MHNLLRGGSKLSHVDLQSFKTIRQFSKAVLHCIDLFFSLCLHLLKTRRLNTILIEYNISCHDVKTRLELVKRMLKTHLNWKLQVFSYQFLSYDDLRKVLSTMKGFYITFRIKEKLGSNVKICNQDAHRKARFLMIN